MTTPATWLTVDEAAQYLRCSERYLRELLANDAVPHVMFAGKALFHPPSLDSWLLTQQTEPEAESRGVFKGAPTMIEADMERLIRDYPGEFLEEPLRLVSQQEAFRSGVTDLIFEDAQGDLVIVELKRGVLQREHVAQLFDYLGDVEDRYKGKHVEVMVVANIIPPQRRTKLERLGVTFKEIPEARFHELAQKYNVSLADYQERPTAGLSGAPAGKASALGGERVAVLVSCPRQEAASLITELIDYGERFVSGLGRNLKADLENSDYAWISTKVYAQLSRWCHPNRNSEREQWVIPRVHKLSQCLFGGVIERTSHPSYSV